jgi:hypothetical protein
VPTCGGVLASAAGRGRGRVVAVARRAPGRREAPVARRWHAHHEREVGRRRARVRSGSAGRGEPARRDAVGGVVRLVRVVRRRADGGGKDAAAAAGRGELGRGVVGRDAQAKGRPRAAGALSGGDDAAWKSGLCGRVLLSLAPLLAELFEFWILFF